jgi:cleavage and polyadenylation specificity factor subunit 3
MSIKRTGVMIAGYAVEGTLAKEIMAQPEVVTLEGRRQPLNALVEVSFCARGLCSKS